MDFFNKKKVQALEEKYNNLDQDFNRLSRQQNLLRASYSPLPQRGATKQNQQRALSEITPRNPFVGYSFLGVERGIGHKYLFETTIAKRLLSVKPQYAMAEPSIIADFDSEGKHLLDSKFTKDVKRIMQSRLGVSSTSPSIFNGNFGGFEKITEADILSYGRWGGIYFVFDDDDPSKPTSKGAPKKLIGMQPLDEDCLRFNKPTEGFSVDYYTVKIDSQIINKVHHSRIVRITDNDGFEHVPRLTDIETEVRNAQDMMLSLMASIGVSRPKIAAVIDAIIAQAALGGSSEGIDVLINTIRDSLLPIIEGDDDVMAAIGTTLPEFIQPKLLEFLPQYLGTVNSISAKTGIPSLIILGSEVGSLASSKDKENFLDTIKQYRNHMRKIIRNSVSVLINARAVAFPANNLEFDIFWAEDKTEIIKTNLQNIMSINNILTSNNFNDDTKKILINLAEKLASEML